MMVKEFERFQDVGNLADSYIANDSVLSTNNMNISRKSKTT